MMNYTVTVTDSSGCTATKTQAITQPTDIAITLTPHNATCAQSNGWISSAVSGGTSPYTYLWSNGASTSSISGLLPGNYTVTVTDASLCTKTASQNISTISGPVVTVDSVKNARCFGQANGAVYISVTGNNGPVTYLWSNAATTQDIVNIVAGTYTVTVTDDNGCTADNTTNVIVNPLPSQPDPITGAPTSVCPHPTDGPYTLSTSATNATSYHWYPGINITGVNFLSPDGSSSIDVEFGTTSNSTYKIMVEASNACGTGPARAVSIRRSVSTPAAVIGNAVACANTNNVAYSCTAVTGATSYEWTITGDATVTGTTENVTVNFGPAWTGGTLCVAAKVGCFTSSTKCMTLSSSVSAAAIGAITGTFTACPNAVQTYSVANNQELLTTGQHHPTQV